MTQSPTDSPADVGLQAAGDLPDATELPGDGAKRPKRARDEDKPYLLLLQLNARQHLTMLQMVDRKARILLSLNAVILSLIIGRVITNQLLYDGRFYMLIFLGLTTVVSIVAAILAVYPERVGLVGASALRRVPLAPEGVDPDEEAYVQAFESLRTDAAAAQRAIIRDTFRLGVSAERKRVYLRVSLWALLVGLSLALVAAVALRFALA